MTRATGLPTELATRPNAVVRPRDAAGVYTNPSAEFRRLVANGTLCSLARGYYVIVPRQWLLRAWRPDLNAVALGIAQADYGTADAALTNVSAARHHGVLPRAIAVATVAVPVQRPVLRTTVGTVIFTKRAVSRLDVEAVRTELTEGWVTTREQTLVDLVARPERSGLDEAQLGEVLVALGDRVDWDRAVDLARAQRKLTAVERLRREGA